MGKRYAIYARFSSDLQNEKSATDQVFECKKYIEKRGGQTVAVYKDEAISGATVFRPDYQRLLKDLEAETFDVLLAEGLDRLSRNQGDIAKLYELLQFHGIALETLAEGDQIDSMHIAFKGLANADYLKTLRAKTIRGLEGRIREGKNPGSCPYGFEPSRDLTHEREVIRGELIRNEAEIAVVERIFIEFAEGKSAQKIADGLNAEHIPGPSGKAWRAKTITGTRSYGRGILNNESYIGKRIWKRGSLKKNPVTGKSKYVPNPESEWIIRDAPELCIISDNLWKSVKARQDEITQNAPKYCFYNQLRGKRRHHYILSGLLKCGECGANYAMISKDRYGCGNRKAKLGCCNGQTIRRQVLEEKVFALLMNEFLQEERVETFVAGVQSHLKRLQLENDQKQKITRIELRKVEKNLEGILKAIEQGIFTDSTKGRLQELEKRKSDLEGQLITLPAINLPKEGVIKQYREIIQNLPEMLDDEAIRHKSVQAIRPLIDKIILHPVDKGLRGEFYGQLENLVNLHACFDDGFFIPQSQISHVLGTQNTRYLTQEPIIIDLPLHIRMKAQIQDHSSNNRI